MLIKLHEATVASTVDAIDAFPGMGFYMPRYDCVVHHGPSHLGSQYKIFRDGSVVRLCNAAYQVNIGYDFEKDLTITTDYFLGANYLNDPISTKRDYSRPSSLSFVGIDLTTQSRPFVYGGYYYHAVPFTATVKKRNLSTGAEVATITTTGSQSIVSNNAYCDITPDGVLVVFYLDNGSFGVARFYDLVANEMMYESVFARSKDAWIDRVNRNIWSLRLSDSKLEIYSFDPAPYAFSPFTVGSNRSRYRQDAITTTLTGQHGEVIPNWPVGWLLTHTLPEGHLQHDFTETDEDGVTTNLYCGPGADDFLGQSTTIEAWTGF